MTERSKPPGSDPEFERWVRKQAAAFVYPKTPELRRLLADLTPRAWWRPATWRPAFRLAITLSVVLAALLSVPAVRAAVLEWIQIGAVRIFVSDSGPGRETELEIPSMMVASFLNLEGETTLEDASLRAEFDVLLPAYPESLGKPDRVYFQELEGGPAVILVWLDPREPDQILLSLLQLGPNTFVSKDGFLISKEAPSSISELTVDGNPAFWLEGDHVLFLLEVGETVPVGIEITSNVLVWEAEGVTYRLESDLELVEALRIAESVR